MKMVSVIIPVFNASKWIEETVQSVLNQTYQNFEIIAINDGSKDDSLAILTKLAQKDNRIKVIDKLNSGVSDTRNVGLDMVKGDFIAFLDADDIWYQTNLQEKLDLLKNEAFDWVYSDALLINENSEEIGEEMKGNDTDILKHYLLWDRDVVSGPCSNIIIKRKCIEDGLRFDKNFSTAADQDFCINLSVKFKGKRIERFLWAYRVLPNSMSRNIAVMEKDHLAVYNKATKNKLFHSWWFKKKCFSNLYLILAGSWWHDAKNKKRAVYFLFKSLLSNPLKIGVIFNKFIRNV